MSRTGSRSGRDDEASQRHSRRVFLRRVAWGAAGLFVGGTAVDAALERTWLDVTKPSITIPGLAGGCDGLTICHLTDIHHGPYLGIERVAEIVDLVLRAGPDLIVLTGDMVHREAKYVEPVWEELRRLRAPLGVYCVMGNHEYYEGIRASRRAARAAGIPELNNCCTPVYRGNGRFWLAGVDDMSEGNPDGERAVRGIPAREPVVLLSHNPDYADVIADKRVGLILAGHSHGGQVVLPFAGPVVLPCKRKYAAGLAKAGSGHVYTSRGIGMATLPIRINCRPELPFITLRADG